MKLTDPVEIVVAVAAKPPEAPLLSELVPDPELSTKPAEPPMFPFIAMSPLFVVILLAVLPVVYKFPDFVVPIVRFSLPVPLVARLAPKATVSASRTRFLSELPV